VITLGRRVLTLGLALVLSLGRPAAAQRRAAGESSLPLINTRAIDAHLKYLADDLLEGRAPATRGGRLAAKYVAAAFEALGLEPGGPSGSYFQPVALVGMTPQPTLAWGKGSDTATPRYGDDFVAWAERPEEHIAVDGDVVFVGYGIRAPEWQWDDYKGVPLRGKVLLMLVNDPGLQDSTIFNGKALTYYGRWTYKLRRRPGRGPWARCSSTRPRAPPTPGTWCGDHGRSNSSCWTACGRQASRSRAGCSTTWRSARSRN